MAESGQMTSFIEKRCADTFGLNPADVRFRGCPCRIWDMLGDTGIPVRVTVSDMGPVLLARLLGLTDVQEGVLNIVFRVADDMGMLLIDLKDLRSMLTYVSEHAKEYQTLYGNVSPASVGAIQRTLISVEDQGGDVFFGEPALDLGDWFTCAPDGRGYVNILNAAKLIQMPQIYAMLTALEEAAAWPSSDGLPRYDPAAVDAVCFVPATSSAYVRRGFDHMELVSRALCAETGLVLHDALVRERARDQRVLGRDERAANLGGSMRVCDEVAGMRLLLLDDVVTTGSSVREATRVLRARGAVSVTACALARVW